MSLRVRAQIVAWMPVAALLLSVILISRLGQENDQAAKRASQAQELRLQCQNAYILLIAAESTVRGYSAIGHEDGIQSLELLGPSVDAVFDRSGIWCEPARSS